MSLCRLIFGLFFAYNFLLLNAYSIETWVNQPTPSATHPIKLDYWATTTSGNYCHGQNDASITGNSKSPRCKEVKSQQDWAKSHISSTSNAYPDACTKEFVAQIDTYYNDPATIQLAREIKKKDPSAAITLQVLHDMHIGNYDMISFKIIYSSNSLSDSLILTTYNTARHGFKPWGTLTNVWSHYQTRGKHSCTIPLSKSVYDYLVSIKNKIGAKPPKSGGANLKPRIYSSPSNKNIKDIFNDLFNPKLPKGEPAKDTSHIPDELKDEKEKNKEKDKELKKVEYDDEFNASKDMNRKGKSN